MNKAFSAQPRVLRAVVALAVLLFLGTFAPPSLFSMAPPVRPAAVGFDPLPLDDDAPGRRRIGRLAFLAGWELTSDNPRFGGISALHVDQGLVVAISDAGGLIRFPLPRKGRTRVAGTIDSLTDGPGSASVKSDRDSESMVIFGGKAWIGFERRNAVWRYSVASWRSDARHAPAAMRGWPNNSGAEGIVRLRDGRFVIFSEGARNKDGSSKVVLFDGDPALPRTTSLGLGYRPPAGYRVTDAGLLPDGRLLILNRRATILEGVSAKLVVARLPRPGAGSLIAGTEIADLRPPINIDNMEALSVAQERGRTIVWLASDDNFNPLQRTLLLKFALEE